MEESRLAERIAISESLLLNKPATKSGGKKGVTLSLQEFHREEAPGVCVRACVCACVCVCVCACMQREHLLFIICKYLLWLQVVRSPCPLTLTRRCQMCCWK